MKNLGKIFGKIVLGRHFPVEPKPPVPRPVPVSSATWV